MRGTPLEQLVQQLQECQKRLGTPAERADDLLNAQAVAHEINNRTASEYLTGVTKRLRERESEWARQPADAANSHRMQALDGPPEDRRLR